MSDFTKGPWVVFEDLGSFGPKLEIYKEGTIGCVVPIVERELGFDEEVDAESTANARLISAAPDMYEALKALVKSFGDYEDDGSGLIGWNMQMVNMLDEANRALRKAEGKA